MSCWQLILIECSFAGTTGARRKKAKCASASVSASAVASSTPKKPEPGHLRSSRSRREARASTTRRMRPKTTRIGATKIRTIRNGRAGMIPPEQTLSCPRQLLTGRDERRLPAVTQDEDRLEVFRHWTNRSHVWRLAEESKKGAISKSPPPLTHPAVQISRSTFSASLRSTKKN